MSNNKNSSSSSSFSNSYQDNPATGGSSYQSGFSNSEQLKSQTNEFFSKRQAENLSRPE
jgi:hypothetical protein